MEGRRKEGRRRKDVAGKEEVRRKGGEGKRRDLVGKSWEGES